MIGSFINTLQSAQGDTVCGAGYGTGTRTGPTAAAATATVTWTHPDRHDRCGCAETAGGVVLPRLAAGAASGAEQALTSVGGDLPSAGGVDAADGQAGPVVGHHRPVEIAGVGDGKDLDARVEAFRTRPLDTGPPLHLRRRGRGCDEGPEAGRVVKIAVLVATGINAEGYREILGVHTATSESAAGGLTFVRDLVDRDLTAAGPVGLVTGDAHSGLVDATGATLPSTSWERCRTHYAADLMSVAPKSPGRG